MSELFNLPLMTNIWRETFAPSLQPPLNSGTLIIKFYRFSTAFDWGAGVIKIIRYNKPNESTSLNTCCNDFLDPQLPEKSLKVNLTTLHSIKISISPLVINLFSNFKFSNHLTFIHVKIWMDPLKYFSSGLQILS